MSRIQRITAAASAIAAALFGLGVPVFALFPALAAPALTTSSTAGIGVLALGSVPLAYIVAAFARCDPGCPATGSARQLVHNAFGLLEYVGGALGLPGRHAR